MEDSITRAEHEEFARRMEIENKRIEDENQRQNKRLDILEKNMESLHSLTTSVEKLANHMANMDKEQEKQGQRLAMLEGRDGETWRKVVAYAITAVVGLIIGYVATHIGL